MLWEAAVCQEVFVVVLKVLGGTVLRKAAVRRVVLKVLEVWWVFRIYSCINLWGTIGHILGTNLLGGGRNLLIGGCWRVITFGTLFFVGIQLFLYVLSTTPLVFLFGGSTSSTRRTRTRKITTCATFIISHYLRSMWFRIFFRTSVLISWGWFA